MAEHRTVVAFLGTGIMGAPMARNLLHAGFEVRVWNRTRQKAEVLAAAGAHIARTPAQAAAGADLLVTMLADGAAVEAAMTGEQGAFAALPAGSVWAQMSTVGVTWAERLAALADGRAEYVDAPVSGSSVPAERGELLILASGEPALRKRVQPVFDAVGRRTLWLDRPGDGSRLKLVLNNWLAVLTEGMAETVAFAEALGLDPGSAIGAVGDSPLHSPYAMAKGRAMVGGDFAPGFPLGHAHKDVGLALEAARDAGTDLLLTEALQHRWEGAVKEGHGGDDVAAVFTQTRTDRNS